MILIQRGAKSHINIIRMKKGALIDRALFYLRNLSNNDIK